LGVGTAQCRNEVILEGANRAFGGVASVDAGWDELIIYAFAGHELLESFGAFVIESLELRP
jgi:hypothetical protein